MIPNHLIVLSKIGETWGNMGTGKLGTDGKTGDRRDVSRKLGKPGTGKPGTDGRFSEPLSGAGGQVAHVSGMLN
jgi:hypothetical protein